ncbi:MAG TPA: DNA translocase FtsK 4TM domain-containing protein, partial [Mesorhizobium sp.]|nr:DNA translocase FtsK 4TM domain-containing protein [Mesorhizobium sp.]
MRSGASAPLALAGTGHGIQAFARRQVGRLVGAGLLASVAFAVASLATWNVADPSFSHATANPVTNAMGYPGAVFSDLAMQFFGLSAVAGLVPAVIWALLLFTARGVDKLPKRGLAWFGFALCAAAMAGCVVPPPTWP